jgi:hypothetical protein
MAKAPIAPASLTVAVTATLASANETGKLTVLYSEPLAPATLPIGQYFGTDGRGSAVATGATGLADQCLTGGRL